MPDFVWLYTWCGAACVPDFVWLYTWCGAVCMYVCMYVRLSACMYVYMISYIPMFDPEALPDDKDKKFPESSAPPAETPI